MQSTWSSLIWKEWHEHKWKLVAITGVLVGATSLAIAIEKDKDKFAGAVVMMVMCAIPLTMFMGLGTGASERSRNTLPFLQSLPLPMWRVAVIKLSVGLFTMVAPIALTVGSFFLWGWILDASGVIYDGALQSFKNNAGAPLSDYGSWHLYAILFGSVVAASFYIWSAAAAMNRKDEVSAAAVALAVVVGWCLCVAAVLHLGVVPGGEDRMWYEGLLLSTAPGGIAVVVTGSLDEGISFALSVAIAATIHVVLIAWFLWRFGRIANLGIRSPQLATPASSRVNWLGPPRQSVLSAIVWKQFRESGPIVVVGLVGTVAVVLCVALSQWLNWGSALAFGMLYTRVAIVFGFFIAVVVGIGVCLDDTRPQLNTFWRSRPIQPDLWFWCKYGTGLAVVLAATYVPILLVAAIGDTSVTEGVNFPNAIVIPFGQIAIFAAAVAVTCLVRHAVYAAILSGPALYLGILVVSWITFLGQISGLLERPVNLWSVSDTQVAAGCLLSFVVYTVIAWLAMRNDWGLKSRY